MNINLDDPKLTAYALDELASPEKEQVETAVASSPTAQEFVRELRLLSGNLRAEYAAEREAHPIADTNIVPLAQKDEPWSISLRLALAAGIDKARRVFEPGERCELCGRPGREDREGTGKRRG
jgi:anti-sigma factor ChrR (cupin superfamily)